MAWGDDSGAADVTWSVLHTDPAPEAFIHNDGTGVTGLIDRTGARRGPVLYDVASTVTYLGGTESATAFLDAYRTHGSLGAQEMQHLDAFRQFREAIQGSTSASGWPPTTSPAESIQPRTKWDSTTPGAA